MKRSLPPRSAGFRHLVDSTANSLRGIRDAFRTAAAFRQECALLVLHCVALGLVPMRGELAVALACLGPVLLATELVNSAIEAVVDLVSPEWSLRARYAKDFGSAAVFLILALIAGLWIAACVCVLRG